VKIVVFLGLFAGYLIIVRWVLDASRKTARKDGYREGCQEGFTDARKYSELWWEVAENEVQEVQDKIRNEERWP
jgi:hypothetical protein